MDRLTLFGLFGRHGHAGLAIALEDRSSWYVFGLSAWASRPGVLSTDFCQGAWPFGVVESIWSLVAARRW